MAEVAAAFVSILPSAKGFGSKLDGQIGGDVKKSGISAGRAFGAAFKGAAVAGVIVAAGVGKGSYEIGPGHNALPAEFAEVGG